MTIRAVAATVFLISWSAASVAAGVSITNRDEKDHKLTVMEGQAKADHVLKPSQVLEGICEKGCIVRLNDSENDEYELEGTEIVSIEEGYLYYDGPEAPNEGQGGDAGKSGQKQ